MMRQAPAHRDPYGYAYRDPYADPYAYHDPSLDQWEQFSATKPVGSVTNSNSAESKKSRLFVGNLNTLVLGKEDVNAIFGPLGNVTGISMHKGYAFVQYSTPAEAKRAMALEQGNVYGGQELDLNIVSEPKKKGPQKRNAADGFNRLAGADESAAAWGPAAKRLRPNGNPSMQRGNLVPLANSANPFTSAQMAQSGMRPGMEPSELGCANCEAVFNSAWDLCLHAQMRHNITIFRA